MREDKKYNKGAAYSLSLILTAAGALLYYFIYRLPLLGIDDANIYFKYMRNVADGLGFVYNPGGERVEGFTSILYTLIGSFIFLLTDNIESVLFIINIAAVSYLIYKVSLFIYNLNKQQYSIYATIFLLTLLLLIMPGYFFWTTLSLMESGIWSMLLCIAILSIFDENSLRNKIKFAILIVLLIATRPEAYFWALYLILLKGVYYYLYNKYPLKKVFKDIGIFLLIFIAALAVIITWRYNYFGYPLPNTYYAKVYGSFWYNFKLGVEYLISFLIYTNPLVIMTMVFITFVYKVNIKKITYDEAVQIILALIIIVVLAIPVMLGGDYFKWNRFFIVFLPVLYLPLFNTVFIEKYILNISSLKGMIKNGQYLIISVIGIIIVLSPRESLDELIRGESLANSFYIEVSKDGQELAEFLNNFFDESQLPHISVIAAGMAYKYNGKTFDLMGLNNTKMAHSEHKMRGFKNHDAFNKKVFFESSPDFIYDGLPAVVLRDTNKITVDIYNDEFKSKFINRGLDEIWFDEKFQAVYKPVTITKKQTDEHILTWANIEYLQNLDSTRYFIKYIPY